MRVDWVFGTVIVFLMRIKEQCIKEKPEGIAWVERYEDRLWLGWRSLTGLEYAWPCRSKLFFPIKCADHTCP